MSSKKKARKNVTPPSEAPAPSAPSASQAPPAAPAPRPAAALPPLRRKWAVPALALLFFLGTCFSSDNTIKTLVVLLVTATVASCLFRFSYVRDRLSLPLMAVAAWLLMNGISTFYAVSGKFALRGFLRLLVGFCCILLILAWSRRGVGSGRAAAAILAGGTALASLVSIDMLSTHLISGPVLGFFGLFSNDFVLASRNAVEAGVRMNSLYENPNVFAGIAGLGVLLSLELAVTARREGERPFHLVCLFLNALAFLLVFSMGASGMIALAFLALLLMERKSRRASLLVLMVETLVLVLLAVFPIFLTSFDEWDGFQPVPLLCAVGGAAALCLLDRFVGQRVSEKLSRYGKLVPVLIVLALVLLAAFAAAAVNLTGGADLSAGESLRRAEYPQPGAYTLEVRASGDVQVSIESQNQEETMMHTSTALYSGPAQGAAFTVPEGSLVTYFNFYAGEDVSLDSAVLAGEGTSTALKLDYKLLPGFIANRLQGLFANENAIQRVVFFADGMKLFRRSPVFGLGVGSFENACQGVQSFYYETKYAHNHYVETLVSTGVVGLVLFLAMLGLCALAVLKNLRRGEEADPLAPALGAALLFMMGHAGVEVVLSFCFYLPLALGVLGLICLCCGGELALPLENEDARSWCVVGMCGVVVAYTVLLGMNMWAAKAVQRNTAGDTYRSLALAEKLDFFEKNDYMLSYVYLAQGEDRREKPKLFTQANEYAERLGKVDSNAIPPYLAEYYFSTNQPEKAVAALKKYVDYVSADSKAWQSALTILEEWTGAYPENGEAAEEIYGMLQSWNRENMGSITLTEENQAYLEGILGG